MSERRRRTSRKVLVKQAQPADIRAQLARNYSARQVEWSQQLDNEKVDWVCLLSLHLQMSEIEHLDDALQEFA
jgi:hypothetical protein